MFKLLRYFSITSLIAFIVVTVLLAIFYRQIILRDLIQIAEGKNIALTQAFSNSLWPQFRPFVTSASGLSPDELRTHPEITRLHQAVLTQMKNLSVVKVKVYNLDGLTVFSTDPAQIGEDKSTNAGFLSARAGQVASELTHRDTFSAFEGTISDRDLFSSYIPIRQGDQAAPIEAVFEVYDDVTPLIQRIDRSQRNIVLGGISILALLYAALFFIVRHANRIIQDQYSELKQKEGALRQSEAQFRRVVSSISDHIYMTEFTAEGGPTNRYLSPNIETLTGYPREKFLADWSFWPSQVVHPEDRGLAKVQFDRLTGGQDSEIEYRLIRADGEIIWVRDNGRVEKDSVKNSLLIYGLVGDITERKQAQQALARAHKQALEASQFKSQLLANVSHDLRTPLSAILGYTEMLQEGIYGPLLEKQRQITQKVINSTANLTGLVNQLLDQAQLEAGALKLNIIAFAPAELVEPICSTVEPLTKTKGLQFSSDIAANMPEILHGDLNRLYLILTNLIDNAVKFTEQGSVQLRIYCPDPAHWAMEVSDTGCGIPAELQSHIFDPFWQIDGTVTRTHEGAGLGLSIVKQLVGLMHGEISLESNVGQGTKFTILMPLSPETIIQEIAG